MLWILVTTIVPVTRIVSVKILIFARVGVTLTCGVNVDCISCSYNKLKISMISLQKVSLRRVQINVGFVGLFATSATKEEK